MDCMLIIQMLFDNYITIMANNVVETIATS